MVSQLKYLFYTFKTSIHNMSYERFFGINFKDTDEIIIYRTTNSTSAKSENKSTKYTSAYKEREREKKTVAAPLFTARI